MRTAKIGPDLRLSMEQLSLHAAKIYVRSTRCAPDEFINYNPMVNNERD